MRRLDAPKTGADAVAEVQRMALEGVGLDLLRRQLGPDATRADALRFWRRLRQESRTRCSFLDEELGIDRD